MTVEEKRLVLRDKVEAGKKRIAERDFAIEAQEAAEKAKGFVADHPMAVIGGAILVGLILGSQGKKSAVAKAAAAPKKKSNVVAALLAEAAISYGLKMIDKARKGAANDA